MPRFDGAVRKIITGHRVAQARYAAFAVVDAVDKARGQADPELPPKRLRDFVGGGDFRTVGREMADLVTELTALQPTDNVLDVGSGIGRVALPLSEYLRPPGSYDGLEIVKRGVDWCTRNITSAHPNFRFHHADLRNTTYNPRGALQAENYRFPFADDSFDVALLTSVFTHLLSETVEHYVAELARVLRPGARVLGTWFILDAESEAAIASGKAAIALTEPVGAGRVVNPESPEDAIGFPASYVRELFERNGFSVDEPFTYGTWSGRAGRSFQDVVIARRP
jgi:SAM-dependent methyltransferase